MNKNKGRKLSVSHREALSKAHKGQISWRKGKKFVDENESKEKRELYIKKWRKDNKKKISENNEKYRKNNKEKIAEQARKRYKENAPKELDRIRLKRYGITGDEYRNILKKQGEKCPICNHDMTKNLSVDHNHLTGKIRGIICNKCNLAIGHADDSPSRLLAMARYLEDNNE